MSALSAKRRIVVLYHSDTGRHAAATCIPEAQRAAGPAFRKNAAPIRPQCREERPTWPTGYRRRWYVPDHGVAVAQTAYLFLPRDGVGCAVSIHRSLELGPINPLRPTYTTGCGEIICHDWGVCDRGNCYSLPIFARPGSFAPVAAARPPHQSGTGPAGTRQAPPSPAVLPMPHPPFAPSESRSDLYRGACRQVLALAPPSIRPA